MSATPVKRVLITGGAGFIGSHVVKHCLALGHEVVVLDDLSGGFEDHIPEGALFVEGSVVDHELVTELFEEHRFDYVYHLAAYAAEGLSHFIKRFNYNNNLIGSVNLINASVNHVSPEGVALQSGELLRGGTIVAAIGTSPPPLPPARPQPRPQRPSR